MEPTPVVRRSPFATAATVAAMFAFTGAPAVLLGLEGRFGAGLVALGVDR